MTTKLSLSQLGI